MEDRHKTVLEAMETEADNLRRESKAAQEELAKLRPPTMAAPVPSGPPPVPKGPPPMPKKKREKKRLTAKASDGALGELLRQGRQQGHQDDEDDDRAMSTGATPTRPNYGGLAYAKAWGTGGTGSTAPHPPPGLPPGGPPPGLPAGLGGGGGPMDPQQTVESFRRMVRVARRGERVVGS